MKLLLDDDAECTLEDFMKVNQDTPDVNPISNDDAEAVCALAIGDEIYVETVKVKRIA